MDDEKITKEQIESARNANLAEYFKSHNYDCELRKDKLHVKGYGKYVAVKSPKAQRFVRLKSLGDDYLPKNLERRIAEKEKFPNAVAARSKNAVEVEHNFYAAITQTFIEVRTLRYKPSKTNPKNVYSFDNDKDIRGEYLCS